MQDRHPLPRRFLLATPLAWLAGLSTPNNSRAASLPEVPDGPGSSSARARLHESAQSHGLAAWPGLRDINASFSAAWSTAAGWLPPTADAAQADGVQADATQAVQLRLLPGAGLAAVRPAAAQPADALRLLLLGPLALQGHSGAVNWGPPETLDDRRCDQLLLTPSASLGLAAPPRIALFIDRDIGLLRRLRVELDGPGRFWGRVAEVDFFDHRVLYGVTWPTRFAAPTRGLWPLARPQTAVLTGLDVNRGYGAEAISTEPWGPAAAAAARLLIDPVMPPPPS